MPTTSSLCHYKGAVGSKKKILAKQTAPFSWTSRKRLIRGWLKPMIIDCNMSYFLVAAVVICRTNRFFFSTSRCMTDDYLRFLHQQKCSTCWVIYITELESSAWLLNDNLIDDDVCHLLLMYVRGTGWRHPKEIQKNYFDFRKNQKSISVRGSWRNFKNHTVVWVAAAAAVHTAYLQQPVRSTCHMQYHRNIGTQQFFFWNCVDLTWFLSTNYFWSRKTESQKAEAPMKTARLQFIERLNISQATLFDILTRLCR